ncbi:preprotein translocase subunit SecE [Litoribacillus peritrichatus]|uniref:Protein translocase subunit SecE n=1 Tax=Litoribacillus peritrichatus TaxID=718191 RepID=A0ABP7N1E3_9GAMM
MNSNIENQKSPLDIVKWVLVAALVSVAVVGNSVFSDESLLYRVIAVLVLAVVALGITLTTEHGKQFSSFVRLSWAEVKKVVWPTREETRQTTIIVVVAVLIVGVILYLMDTLFGWLVKLLIG